MIFQAVSSMIEIGPESEDIVDLRLADAGAEVEAVVRGLRGRSPASARVKAGNSIRMTHLSVLLGTCRSTLVSFRPHRRVGTSQWRARVRVPTPLAQVRT